MIDVKVVEVVRPWRPASEPLQLNITFFCEEPGVKEGEYSILQFKLIS